MSYPLYMQFEYQPGVEYDIISNASFIEVKSDYGTPLQFYIPPECDGNRVRVKKFSPFILLEIPCQDKNNDNRIPAMIIGYPLW